MMKIHLAWIRVTAAAAIVAGAGVVPAAAQYAPYAPYQPAPQPQAGQQPAVPQQVSQQPAPNGAVPWAQTPYTAWQQQMAQTTAPYQPVATQYPQVAGQYPQAAGPYPQTAGQQYPQTAAPYVPTVPYVPATTQQAVAPYGAGSPYAQAYPAYTAVAQRPNGGEPAAVENEPIPAPEMPANGEPNDGQNDEPNGKTDSEADGHADAQAANGPTNDGSMNGYYPGTAGCECNDGYVDYGVSSYFNNPFHESQWFGGVYFLFMERDNATPAKLTVEVDHSVVSDPYYPQADTTALGTHFVDYDYREGVEVRVGSTFTIGQPCDTGGYGGCNGCAPCTGDLYAWELAWWGLDDDVETYTAVDGDGYPTRLYGMKNFAGLEYGRTSAGGVFGYRPVNDYYGYALPIADPGAEPYADGYVAVLAQRVRTNFKAQNLELNIFRFPVCQIACGGCNSGCGPAAGCYGGCDSGCYGGYGEEERCPMSFSMYGSCGVRYFRVDDDFMYANEFTEWDGGAPDKAAHDGFYDGESNEMYYDVQVENNLVGPQVGWTMNYAYGCKWNFFCNSTFGFFNNHISHQQQMWGGGDGDVRFAQGGESFNVRSHKDDFSFLGELRLGGSYDVSCHWRAVLAYRAVAIAGLATSVDQIPDEFTNPEWVAIIDSDNSMIVHGVQVGAECRY